MSYEFAAQKLEGAELPVLSAVDLLSRFGMTAVEADVAVQFGNHSGTVAQMLADEKCPVGGMMAQAYADKGIAGVREQFGFLDAMSGGGFSEVKIEDKTPDQINSYIAKVSQKKTT